MISQREGSPVEETGRSPVAAVDRARLEELARAIESGHYVVDSERIAEKLIDGGFPQEVNPE